MAVFFHPAAEIQSLAHEGIGEDVFRPINERHRLRQMDLSIFNSSAFKKVDRTVCIYIEGHVDKFAARWTPGDQVRLYLDGLYFADLRKNVPQSFLSNVGR